MVLCASAAAQAQEAAKPADKTNADTTTVVVTGVRAALAQSLNQKRNADSHVEVITSEDVGKMPDKSVADSLQRIPGVSVATAGGSEGGFGENDRVSMHGTPSNLTLTTLNGHTVSSGDWYVTNITSGGRSVSYSMFPSELIGRVVVNKSAQANLTEGGAAGTVDIETRKPLSFKAPLTMMGSVEGAYGSASKKTDAQVSGLVNWKNDTNTAGILIQAFDEKRQLQRLGQEFLWWDKVDTWFANDWINKNPEVKGKYLSLLTGSALFKQTRERKGGFIDAQFKPSNDFSFDISGLYTRLNADNVNANFMFSPYQNLSNNWSGVNGAIPSKYTITGNNISSITFPSTCPAKDCSAMGGSVQDIISRPGSYSDSKFLNLDWKYRANDDLSFTGQFGTTRGTGHAQDYGYEAWLAYSGATLTTYGLSAPATVTIDNAGTFNPRTGADFFGGWASQTTSNDKENYAQADGTYKTPWNTVPTIKFGARAAKHERSLESINGNLAANAGTLANRPTGLTNYPTSPLANVLQNPWTFTGDSVNAWGNKYVTFSGHAYQNEFQISEKANAVYAMGDLTTDALQGNFGMRYVHTQIDVANGSGNTVWNPVITNRTYNNMLPSLNLRTDLSKDVVLRAAASRTMARPDFGTLGALSLNDITLSGSGGNPNLKPIMSNNVDVGFEWYFAPKSMFGANLYSMNIGSYVTFGSSTQAFYNNAVKAITNYNMSSALNTKAEVKGFEIQYVQDLGNGFGVNANYTYADGKETAKAPKSACADLNNCDMVGTSKNSYNLGAFFENSKWSARLNYSFRSAFLNGLDRNSAIYQDDVGTVSASVGYAINDNLTLSFEGKDLNDPLLKSYATTKDQPRAFYKNGRQFFFGLRGKM